jgi:peptide/nickel transport system substrate-binding protein
LRRNVPVLGSVSSRRWIVDHRNAEVDKLIDKQSAGACPETQKDCVRLERKQIEDDARPILLYTRAANCREPYLKGPKTMVNSIYNSSQFKDLWVAN